MPIKINAPLTDEAVKGLKSGDEVLITGTIYTARDAAHKRLMDALNKGEEPPFPLKGAIIYYVGPTPARPGNPIGSAGPTTSGRMDVYAPRLHALGVKASLGKGKRNKDVIDACKEHCALYLAATGGVGALISKRIKACEVIAYPDLGPEAVHKLEVEDFPAVVIIDSNGANFYEEGIKPYRTVEP